MSISPALQAARNRRDAENRKQRQLEKARRAAAANLGCDCGCGITKADLAVQQARMKAETMARRPEWFA